MKIYTKNGDKGSTSLLGGYKVSKDNLRVAAIGDVDELNAHIGLLYSQLSFHKEILFNVLNNLFVIGAQLAAYDQDKFKIPKLNLEEVQILEQHIDAMQENLEPMTHFILPTGDLLTSYIHIARSVCRRAERSLVALNATENIHENILIYINRMSDYLFVIARMQMKLMKIQEVKWNL